MRRNVQGEFAETLAAYVRGLTVGDGMVDDAQMGPLTNPRRLTAMTESSRMPPRKASGCRFGGGRIGDAGNCWRQATLDDVTLSAKGFNDELFVPMAASTVRQDRGGNGRSLSPCPSAWSTTRSLEPVCDERAHPVAVCGSGHAVGQPARRALGRVAVLQHQGFGALRPEGGPEVMRPT